MRVSDSRENLCLFPSTPAQGVSFHIPWCLAGGRRAALTAALWRVVNTAWRHCFHLVWGNVFVQVNVFAQLSGDTQSANTPWFVVNCLLAAISSARISLADISYRLAR